MNFLENITRNHQIFNSPEPPRHFLLTMSCSSLLVRVVEWTTCPHSPMQAVDRGSGCIDIVQPEHEFLLCVSGESVRTELLIDTSTSIRRDGDFSIILSAPNSSTEYAIIFADTTSATIVWIALCLLTSGQADSFVAMPTLDNITLLHKYITTVHPIMRTMIARSVARPDFLIKFYDAFAAAEMQKRFDLLPHFRLAMLAIFQLSSRPVLTLLLSVEYIDRTIACLEYDPSLGDCNTFQTTNRVFLDHTKLHCVLPSLHDRFKAFAYANYRIAYLKNAILCHHVIDSVLTTIDSIAATNSSSIVHILLSDSQFAKKLTGSMIPVMISLNNTLVLTAAPNELVLRFLIELFKLPIPQSGMRRLVRKLCDSRLLELLDQSFASTTQPSTQCLTLDVLSSLHNISHTSVVEHILSPQSTLVDSIVKRLTDNSEMSAATDRALEFLQSFIAPFDKIEFSVDLNTRIGGLVELLLPAFIRSLNNVSKTNRSLSDKQRKVCDFVGFMIQTRPDLCRTRFGGCVTWFVSLADRALIDLDLSAQQKQLCLSSVRLLHNAAAVSDDFYVRSLLSRTGFADSIVLMLVANQGSDNMLSSVVQGMVCKMAQHWLSSLIDGRAAQLVNRMPAKSLRNALHQLTFAVSSAVQNVCANRLSSDEVSAKPYSVPSPLLRKNSLDLYCSKTGNFGHKQPASVDRPPLLLQSDMIAQPDHQAELRDAKADNARLNERCQTLTSEKSVLADANSKLQSENESMSQQLREMRRQLAVHRLATAAGAAVRRQQNAALGRWKSVVAEQSEPVQSSAANQSQSDPFLMDALYVLAWQRKVDRSRAMALALRWTLLPLLKRHHLRRALHSWRESVRALKATLVVQTPMEKPMVAAPPQVFMPASPSVVDQNKWQSMYGQPLTSTSFHSEGSRSSFASASDSAWILAHQHTPRSGSGSGSLSSSRASSVGSTPSASKRDVFGEEVGAANGIKRTDSDTFFMIRNLKKGDPFLGCKTEPSFINKKNLSGRGVSGGRISF